MNCSSPYSARVAALSLPCSAPECRALRRQERRAGPRDAGGGRVGPAPRRALLLAVRGEGGGLVLALQRAVVPLVEPPGAAHRDPLPVGGGQRQLGGADRPPAQRGGRDPRQ